MKQIDENNWELDKNRVLRKTKSEWILPKIIKRKKPIIKYEVIYPIKTQGKINWRNLIIGDGIGILYVLIFVILAFTYMGDTKECRELVEDYNSNPRKFCSKYIITNDIYGDQVNSYYGFNITPGGYNEFGLPLPS